MSDSFLNIFQLFIAIYLFYMAWKGDSTTFQIETLPKNDQLRTKRKLKILYVICGCIALSEFGVSILKNQMFAQTVSDSGTLTITQNFKIPGMSFISFRLLSMLSTILSILIFVMLIGIVIWIYKKIKKVNVPS